MAEFSTISSLLHEKCEENSELRKFCHTIGSKYLDYAKKELRAQYAREENIMLKLDVGNLQSAYRTVTENNDAQAELDSRLMEHYADHLKFSFDIDECELEKLASYDEIKLELEQRDSNNMYQRLYERKIKIVHKMEQRNIVKRYKQTENECSKTETERHELEEKVNKLKTKAKESKARQVELIELTLQLVQGSSKLEAIYADKAPQTSLSQVKNSGGGQRLSGLIPHDLNKQKVGLSSRLLVNFEQFQFKIPSIHSLPRIRKINQRSGLNRLLQQSEVIRKSMATSPILLSGELDNPKLAGILKISNAHPKLTEGSQKTVSFDVDLSTDPKTNIETQEMTTKSPSYTLQPYSSEIVVDDSDMEVDSTEKELKKPKIEITENVLIKPSGKIFKHPDTQSRPKIKRKGNNSDDSEYQFQSSPKLKRSSPEPSLNFGSKSFMEMFMDLSKDTPEVASPDFEPINNLKEGVKENEKVKDVKEKKTIKKQEPKPKTKASIKQFDGFEDFLSQFGGDTNDNDQTVVNDSSFDFGNDDDDDHNDGIDDGAECDNFSFDF